MSARPNNVPTIEDLFNWRLANAQKPFQCARIRMVLHWQDTEMENGKTSQMINTEKNISQMKITILYKCVAQVLLIFMSDIFFLYMSNEGCFIFIIHHFVRFIG